jgi:hypothetical protein
MVHRGLSTWYDDFDAGLALLSRTEADRVLALSGWTGELAHDGERLLTVGTDRVRWAESIFATLQADRMAETLSLVDGSLLSRLLYCWPVPRLEARLGGATGDPDAVHALMQRLVDLPGTREVPHRLALAPAAADRLQELLPQWRGFMRDADGLEAAWIGKAAGNVVRLAGLLALMDWASGRQTAPCTTVGEDHLDRAHMLWTDYFWPHARGVFGQAASTLAERQVRRVGRWLKRMRPDTVSREEVRREALGQAVDADTAESVIERLEQHGVVRMLQPEANRGGGPRRRRWEVNPELWAS